MVPTHILNNIFSVTPELFPQMAWQVAQFQQQHNAVYQEWCGLLGVSCFATSAPIVPIEQIPFLPIRLFKSHQVVTTFFEPEVVFESSGTTNSINSKHYVKSMSLYQESYLQAFRHFYGSETEWCIIGLLPSYLERSGSSLVTMVNDLIVRSGHIDSGFYLYDFDKLANTLKRLHSEQQPIMLIGVTFALLDFAAQYPMDLHNMVVIETGGMKGRRKEMVREEVQAILKKQWQLPTIHAEYGMTELLSQAYSKGDGIFVCPPWMRVLVRSEDNPLEVKKSGRGILNVIDLCNVYGASFIATDDVGEVFEDGSFTILGRMDNSDIRGCSLLVV